MELIILERSYDSRRKFRLLSDSSIGPVKGEEESNYKSKGYIPWKLSVIKQKEDLDAW